MNVQSLSAAEAFLLASLSAREIEEISSSSIKKSQSFNIGVLTKIAQEA